MSRLKEWRALDHCDEPQNDDDAKVDQEGEQTNITQQESYEWIVIKDSEDVNVTSTDTQAALTIQAGIQVAIAVVLEITILDSNQSESVSGDLQQLVKTRQSNRQKTIVEKSKDVEITTTNTDIALNIQLLLQVLIAILVTLDIL